MSMMGRWQQVSPALLARIRARPALLEDLLNADLGRRVAGTPVPEALRAHLAEGMQDVAAKLPPKQREAFLAQVRAMQEAMAGETPAEVDGTGPSIDLEKAWHGIHYLLCGSAEPTGSLLSAAVMGGTEIGPDRGYGPVRFLTVDEVGAVAAALETIRLEDLRSAYDGKAMEQARIYPGGWDQPECLDWLMDSLIELKEFYRRAATDGAAVLLFLQ
jgi:uncharacterized protein DUF1877